MAGELTLPDALQYRVFAEPMMKFFPRQETYLQDLYGVLPGGPNFQDVDNDVVNVDELQNSPGLLHGLMGVQNWPKGNPMALGAKYVSLLRLADAYEYTGDRLNRLRQIGQPNNVKDKLGRAYAAQQLEWARRNALRSREFALIGMMLDSLYLKPVGNAFTLALSSAGSAIQIPMQIPAANKNQLAGTITTTWLTTSTPIASDQRKIFALAVSGRLPTEWHMNPTTFNTSLLVNLQLQALAGTAATPFSSIAIDTASGVETIKFVGMPLVNCHIHYRQFDTGGGTLVNPFPNNVIVMTPNKEAGFVRGIQGTRIKRLPGETESTERTGLLQWWDWDTEKTEDTLVQYISDLFLMYFYEADIYMPTVIF